MALSAQTKLYDDLAGQETVQDTVIFTSFDGQTFELTTDPDNLGRATALASEKTLSKIWGTLEEETSCHDISKAT